MLKKMTAEIQAIKNSGEERVRLVGYSMVNNKKRIMEVAEFFVVNREGYVQPFTKSGDLSAWVKKVCTRFVSFDEVEIKGVN